MKNVNEVSRANKYSKLTIEPSEEFLIKYLYEKRIGKFFGSYLPIRLIVIALAKLIPIAPFINLRRLAGSYAGVKTYIRRRTISQGNPLSFKSGFGYSEKTEMQTAYFYKKQLEERENNSATDESFDLYEHADHVLSDLLSKDSSIEVSSNFGVSYAYLDSVLAKKFANCQFVGIDRSKLTQEFNQKIFNDQSNLRFEALDIFEYLANQSQCGVLVHMRTCTLLPKQFLLKLYRAAFKAKVKYIVGFEQIGWSRETDNAYRFSDDDQESVVFRGFMNIHNYPGILKAAGFRLDRIELLKTAHPDDDYRIISFTASKID